MAARYTTTALVVDEVKVGYNTTTDLATADVTTIIEKVDGIIDSALAHWFYPFNATGSTPTTPKEIGEIALSLSLYYAYRRLATRRANSGLYPEAEEHKKHAYELLGALQENPTRWIKPEATADEAITFGTGLTKYVLGTNEAQLASTTPLDSGDPPHIYPGTVRCTTTGYTLLEPDVDFTVKWDKRGSGIYVLTRYDAAIVDDFTFTYEWDYRRDRGDKPRHSGRLLV